jgi:hypothetical protein
MKVSGDRIEIVVQSERSSTLTLRTVLTWSLFIVVGYNMAVVHCSRRNCHTGKVA